MVVLILMGGDLSSGKFKFIENLKNNFDFELSIIQKVDYLSLSKMDEIELNNFKQSFLEKYKEVMKHHNTDWNKKAIVYPIIYKEQLSYLKNRSWIKLMYLASNINTRYSNLKQKYNLPDLEHKEFCELDDFYNYNLDSSYIRSKSQFTFFNKNNEIKSIVKQIKSNNLICDVVLKNKFRYNYDDYFMLISYVAKNRSNCMKRPVGSIIVKDNRVLSIGYNGTPYGIKNCFEMGCARCNNNTGQGKELEKCFCLHAEESAILEVGGKLVKDTTIYTTLFPCLWCAKMICQVKIKKVVYSEEFDMKESYDLLKQFGIEILQVDMSNVFY